MKKESLNAPEEQGSSLWKDAFLRLSRNRAAMCSLLALVLIVASCFLGPLLPWLPHPNVQDLARIAELFPGTTGSAQTSLGGTFWHACCTAAAFPCWWAWSLRRVPGYRRGVWPGFRLWPGQAWMP